MTSFQRTEHQGVHRMPLYILSQNNVINVTTNNSLPVTQHDESAEYEQSPTSYANHFS